MQTMQQVLAAVPSIRVSADTEEALNVIASLALQVGATQYYDEKVTPAEEQRRAKQDVLAMLAHMSGGDSWRMIPSVRRRYQAFSDALIRRTGALASLLGLPSSGFTRPDIAQAVERVFPKRPQVNVLMRLLDPKQGMNVENLAELIRVTEQLVTVTDYSMVPPDITLRAKAQLQAINNMVRRPYATFQAMGNCFASMVDMGPFAEQLLLLGGMDPQPQPSPQDEDELSPAPPAPIVDPMSAPAEQRLVRTGGSDLGRCFTETASLIGNLLGGYATRNWRLWGIYIVVQLIVLAIVWYFVMERVCGDYAAYDQGTSRGSPRDPCPDGVLAAWHSYNRNRTLQNDSHSSNPSMEAVVITEAVYTTIITIGRLARGRARRKPRVDHQGQIKEIKRPLFHNPFGWVSRYWRQRRTTHRIISSVENPLFGVGDGRRGAGVLQGADPSTPAPGGDAEPGQVGESTPLLRRSGSTVRGRPLSAVSIYDEPEFAKEDYVLVVGATQEYVSIIGVQNDQKIVDRIAGELNTTSLDDKYIITRLNETESDQAYEARVRTILKREMDVDLAENIATSIARQRNVDIEFHPENVPVRADNELDGDYNNRLQAHYAQLVPQSRLPTGTVVSGQARSWRISWLSGSSNSRHGSGGNGYDDSVV